MFTPEFWKNEPNKMAQALYRINQSSYKEYCEVDEFWVFLARTFPDNIPEIHDICLEYAEYVEERTRINDLNKALNENPGMKKDVKYKVVGAKL